MGILHESREREEGSFTERNGVDTAQKTIVTEDCLSPITRSRMQ